MYHTGMNYYDFVVETVREAGERLLARATDAFEVSMKNNDPRDIVTAVDLELNTFIVGAIRAAFPGHAVYSEEGGGAEAESSYIWTIDPIDGSSNFARRIPHFAICIGLLEHGVPIVGVVYNPITRELFSFKKGEGAFLNGAPIRVSAETELSRAHVFLHAGRKPELWQWGGEGYAKLLEHAKKTSNFGGSALDTCFVAAGRVEGNVYGRLSAMDIASALGILAEAGGVVVGADGKPIVLSTEPQKVFMANNQKMAEELVVLLG